MSFNNYLIESTILYESIKQYNTITEATEEAFIPPTWTVEFTKHEKGKGEFSTAVVKETVRLENKVSFKRVLDDAIKDAVKGFIIMNEDVPIFAGIKDPKDTASMTIMAIDPNPAKKLHRPSWKTYTAHDANYYGVHQKYSEKKTGTGNVTKAIEELLSAFVSNFVKGENDDVELNDALGAIKISAKTITVETDNEKAEKAENSSSDDDDNSSGRSQHKHPAVQEFSKEYLDKYIKDTVKMINDNVPTITKAEKLSADSIDNKFEKINVNDIKKRLDKLNSVIEKFGKEYNDKKNDSSVTSDPDWEKKFAKEYADSLKNATSST